MAEERIPSAKLDFQSNKIEFLDKDGNTISEDSVESLIENESSGKKSAEEKVEEVAKTKQQAQDEQTSSEETDSKEKPTLTKKIYKVARTMMRYSPLGMTYVAGKDFLEGVDKMMSDDEATHDHIHLEQLVELIRIGKYKFDELNMSFNEKQAQDINVRRVRTELDDETIIITFNDQDGGGLDLNIDYQGAKDD